MKRIKILVLILCFAGSFKVLAEENNLNKISVEGSYTYSPEVESYEVQIYMQVANGYNTTKVYTSLTELKKDYLSKVREANLDTSKFSQDDTSYYASGNVGEGTVLAYTTSTIDEATRLAKVRFDNDKVRVRYIAVKYKPLDFDKAFKLALKNAEEKAKEIAKAIHVKLGEVVAVSEYSNSSLTKDSYTPDTERKFSIIVSYSMK